MSPSLQISYFENPTHNVMVLGGGEFGRKLTLDEVMRVKIYYCNLCPTGIMKKLASPLSSLPCEGIRSHQLAKKALALTWPCWL